MENNKLIKIKTEIAPTGDNRHSLVAVYSKVN